MAIYFPNTNISEVGGGNISIPGSVVQIVQTAITGTLSTTTRSTWLPLSSGSATITPTSASNKIYVYFQTCFRKDHTQGAWSLGQIGLYYDTGGYFLSYSGWNGTWRHVIDSYRKTYVHWPNSTAAQTYSLRYVNHDHGGTTNTIFYGNSACAHDGLSFIRLTEIAS